MNRQNKITIGILDFYYVYVPKTGKVCITCRNSKNCHVEFLTLEELVVLAKEHDPFRELYIKAQEVFPDGKRSGEVHLAGDTQP